MHVLLGSGGYRTPERVSLLAAAMRALFGDVGRLLFVPYALRDHDGYVKAMIERGLHAGYELDGIHHYSNPVRAVAEASGLFIGGGNTFRLLNDLYHFGLLDVIRDRVRHGLPYLGVSAGTNVACPAIKTTNDMPIVQPPSLDALGLIPFQINPHYFIGQTFVKSDDDSFHEHFGETRDDRLREYHEMNDLPVVGLWEAALLHCEAGRVELSGAARVFRRGQPAVDVPSGTNLAGLLGGA